MSRIGKIPVILPAKVKATVVNNTVVIEGPKPDPRPVVVAKKEVPRALEVVEPPPEPENKRWFQFWKKK